MNDIRQTELEAHIVQVQVNEAYARGRQDEAKEAVNIRATKNLEIQEKILEAQTEMTTTFGGIEDALWAISEFLGGPSGRPRQLST